MVRLPKDLKGIHIRRAVDYIEKHTVDLVDIYLDQANVFSGIIGIFGIKALHAVSPYKKHKHPDVAQQRFPDLSLGGKLNPPAAQALESKGSTRAWDTFGVKAPAAKLKDAIAYELPAAVCRGRAHACRRKSTIA
jgi:hypothetical protein